MPRRVVSPFHLRGRVVVVAGPVQARTFAVEGPLDLARTLGVLSHGPGDRTFRVGRGRAWYATRTGDGPATVALTHVGNEVLAMARVPDLLGLDRAPVAIPAGPYRLVHQLERRAPGVRIPRTAAVLDSLIPAILEQKVTGQEAHRAWNGLVRVHGEAAPGPEAFGLRLAPAPAILARLPYYAYHPFGIEGRRADLIRRIAARAAWFEAIVGLPFEAAYSRLTAVPGIGPWTAAEVGVRALGDEDAVSVGDFHLKNVVAFALAGAPRGTDERMLELLEPYRGARARVVRLIELSGIQPPKYGPRLSVRRIENL
jgi:3-methyladenine DNA glycosylase/8-oxoguanine DNA glycosylase